MSLDILYDRYKRISQKAVEKQLNKAHKQASIDPQQYRTTPGMCEGIEIVRDPRTRMTYLKNHNIPMTTCLPNTIADVLIFI